MRVQKMHAALVCWFLVAAIGNAQSLGPEVSSDRRITFRLAAPDAETVSLYFGEWEVKPQPMAKGDDGVWSVTVGPVEPLLYAYYFQADGVHVIDPNNPNVKIGGSQIYANLLDVPGSPPRFDEHQDVPHGVIHIVQYTATPLDYTKAIYVYTPPGYYENTERRYPVLYLRHGGGDWERSWSVEGRAGVIADNLIAQGRAEPLIIVMTNGHIRPDARGSSAGSTPDAITLLTKELLGDVIPLVERMFRTLPGPQNRAITGLSMGAGQAFTIGLNNLDTFSWVGQFSSGMLSRTPELTEFDPSEPSAQTLRMLVPALFGNAADVNRRLRLLWLGCGSDDTRFDGQVKFVDSLDELGIRHHPFRQIPGGHEWKVWRSFLADFLQLIFRSDNA